MWLIWSFLNLNPLRFTRFTRGWGESWCSELGPVFSEAEKWRWKSHLTLCNAMDCRDHGILQARILEWLNFPSSRGSSRPRNQTGISCFAGGFFTNWAMREAPVFSSPIYPQAEKTWPQEHACLPKECICFILILSSSFCIKLSM